MTSLRDISESRASDAAGNPRGLWAPARAMVVAGAAANALGFWDDGCRLWRALFRQGAVGEIAAQGCAEAALHAGRFGLADHALAHCGQPSERLTVAIDGSLDARNRQKAAGRICRDASKKTTTLKLLESRSYDAILAYFPQNAGDPEATSIVVRALHGLGRYDGIIALAGRDPAAVDTDIAVAARDRVARRRDAAETAAQAWFADWHAVGA